MAAGVLACGCSIFKKEGMTVNNTPTVQKTPVAPTPKHDEIPTDIQPLLGTWSINEVGGKKVVVNGENHPQVGIGTIDDAPNAVLVIGFNGCNYLNGSWIVRGDKLERNGEFISSLRACDDAPYENLVNLALNDAASYSVLDNNNITINSKAGVPLMVLRRRNLSFLNGAWQVTTIQGQPVPSTTAIKIVIDVDEGKIHGNAGCNIVNGTVVVNLDKGDGIEFKDLATTRMTCPDIATEQQFLLALEEVSTAVEGSSADQAVMKSDNGRLLLTLIRIPASEVGED